MRLPTPPASSTKLTAPAGTDSDCDTAVSHLSCSEDVAIDTTALRHACLRRTDSGAGCDWQTKRRTACCLCAGAQARCGLRAAWNARVRSCTAFTPV